MISTEARHERYRANFITMYHLSRVYFAFCFMFSFAIFFCFVSFSNAILFLLRKILLSFYLINLVMHSTDCKCTPNSCCKDLIDISIFEKTMLISFLSLLKIQIVLLESDVFLFWYIMKYLRIIKINSKE